LKDFVHIDFETRSAVDLLKVGADVYAQHPSTEPMCLAIAFNDEKVLLWKPDAPDDAIGTMHLERLFRHVAKGGKVFGHNIGGFEMLIWNCVMALNYDWPELKIEQCECTMAMAYAMGLPGSLDDASRAAGIPYEKDLKGHRVMLKLSQPKGFTQDGNPVFWTKEEVPDDFEKLYAYCKQDVEVERGLAKRLRLLSPSEQKIWELDYKINRRGVYVDTEAARLAISLVESEKLRLNNKIREVTGNAVAMCTATGQLADWLKSKGLSVPSVAKADVTDMLSQDIPADCRQALLLRQEAAKTSTAKLQAMMSGASIGGRVRGLFQYHGASTGRWAGRRVQLQNLPRPTLKQDKIEQIFELLNRYGAKAGPHIFEHTGSRPMSAISDCIRGFLRARPGYDLIACDFNAIEARVIAWLAGQEETLEVFRGDGKIYELTAAGIYGVKMSDILKEDPRRQVGKVAVLALGYQGGVGALQTMARGYNVKIEPAFELLWKRATDEHKRMAKFVWDMNGKKFPDISQKEFVASDLIKQYWREANPKIVQYWKELNEASILAVENPGRTYSAGFKPVVFKLNGSFLWCRLPSGRVICYPYPKVSMIAPFEDSAPQRTLTAAGVDSYTKKWDRYAAYGGLLAENITQAVARDLLAESMLRAEAAGYPVVMHVHDEAVVEVPKDFGSLEEVKQIMSQVPAWANGLPIGVEGWRGERFRK
jgi:DNA polymerase